MDVSARSTEHGGPTGHGAGGHEGHATMVADYRRRFWISLALSLPVVALAPMLQELVGLEKTLAFEGDGAVQAILSSLVYFYGGWPFFTGMVSELRHRRPGMMTLVAVAITAAYVYSTAVVLGVPGEVFFWELVTLVDIMLLGHWLEMRSVLGASTALEKLVRLMPAEAHRLDPEGEPVDVPVAELTPGDRVLVRPGERVPADGVVLEGRTTLDESLLTGESRPVERGPGDEVIGGAVNGEGAVTVRVGRTGADTYLAQVIEMVRQAQETRSRTQDLADRAAFWLVLVAVGGGVATFAAWLAMGEPLVYAVERMVTVMVIACPHALGLAVPLVVAVSTTLAARHGLLVRDRSAFERARDLDAVIFDKTGTLTEGRFGVTDVVALDGYSTRDALQLAASLESYSEHPIAAGIVRAAQDQGIELLTPREVIAIPGKGARGLVDNTAVAVVSPSYLRSTSTDDGDAQRTGAEGGGARTAEQSGSSTDAQSSTDAKRLAAQGKTVVYLLAGPAGPGETGRPVAAIALADIIRAESRQALDQLRAMGIKVMMLTGDSASVAGWVAGELRLDEYFAEVLPDEKVARVREVKGRGLSVAMVGDGVNDAPALAEADVGIAIGAGTDVAIESADIVLVRSDPRDVVAVVDLARATYRKMRQNLWWATGYNVVALPLAAGVLSGVGIVLSPAIGAALMSVSTVIVAINARLLGRWQAAGAQAPRDASASRALSD